MQQESGLIYTDDNCVGCSKCIRACIAPGASVSRALGGQIRTYVDGVKCISCGACLSACQHGARQYVDDTDAFLAALEGGEAITLLVAPSFRANYPAEYARVLTLLKGMGLRLILPVSFGADICTWAYIRQMQAGEKQNFISTTCPVIVNYVEYYLPELVSHLMPVKSPLMCLATYCRKELGLTEDFAFLGPCIGKKTEMSRSGNEGLVRYNVTFAHLLDRLRAHPGLPAAALPDEELFVSIPAPQGGDTVPGLGKFYPAPGGLGENLRWFLGDEWPVRQVEGVAASCRWLRRNAGKIASNQEGFALIDILNCEMGCLEGPAIEKNNFDVDESLIRLMEIRNGAKLASKQSAWGKDLTPAQRLERLEAQFAHLDPDDYAHQYMNRSTRRKLRIPGEEELNRIFNEMYKTSKASRNINCAFCGYESCREMAVSIANGFNDKRSCIHYLKDEAVRIERMSFRDSLTGVMNRNAYEEMMEQKIIPRPSVGLIVCDLNGLKAVNDNEGHAAGDRLIIAGARCLSDIFGVSNVYRIGGDEFLVLVQDAGEEEILEAMDRLHALMAERAVSMATGFAIGTPGQSIEGLMKVADAMMYKDKLGYYERTGKKRRE